MEEKKAWYAEQLNEVSAEFDTERGLSETQVTESRTKYGENKLAEGQKKNWFVAFINQFKDTTIIILIIASIISMFFNEVVDAIVILAIVVLNAVVGLVQEGKAEKALEELKKMSSPNAKVIREGEEKVVASSELVVGDILVLEAGDLVSADVRLTWSSSLKIQEASLTGESVPVEKHADFVGHEGDALGDRRNMAYSSGMVTYGRGRGIVTAVGMGTEVGKIATLLAAQKNEPTPLQKKLDQMGKMLGLFAIIACSLMLLVGVLEGEDFLEMFMTAVSLAVAVIPESLPAVATIVLAMGVQRLVKKHAIIRNLPSVETLGSATVICSDKTGTLTQNRMTVTDYWNDGHAEMEGELARGMLFCNDARYADNQWIGDPTETALSEWAGKVGLNTLAELEAHPRINEIPFDSGRKRMTTVHQDADHLTVYTKGGVDEVLAVCTSIGMDGLVRPITPEDIAKIQSANKEMAERALRVLAVAQKHIETNPEEGDPSLEGELTFMGLVGMIDPPRPEVKEAIRICKDAGIRAVMITGDHLITASAIAQSIGMLEPDDKVISGKELDEMDDEALYNEVQHIGVYARVSPEHKMRIIEAWRKHGDVVAMTGDGVNDAPALKMADIGAAMGIVGTEVAKGAADMILTDDNFATVVTAVGEGRRIKDNIVKAVSYLLSCNIGEMFLPLVSTFAGWGQALLPIHLLWINLVTDSLPALALGVDPAEDGIMHRKPERGNSLFNGPMVFRMFYQGITIGLGAMLAFLYGSGKLWTDVGTHEQGMTMAFAVLATSQLVHSYNIHSVNRISLFTWRKNPQLILATVINLAMILVVLLVPPLRTLFKLTALDGHHWLVALGLVLIPAIVVSLMKVLHLNGNWKTK